MSVIIELLAAAPSRRRNNETERQKIRVIRRHAAAQKLMDQADFLERWTELAEGSIDVSPALIAAARQHARDKRAQAVKLTI